MIRYLEHKDIKKDNWDRCIETARSETIYPYSWFMDRVSPGWGGLVQGDYEAVMPLPEQRKYGFHISLQPLLTQQLGVFSEGTVEQETLTGFMNAIPKKFRYVNICLNAGNNSLPESIRGTGRVNYELDLTDSGKEYNKNVKRNLQKAQEHAFEVREITIDRYIDFKYSGEGQSHIPRNYMENLYGGLEQLGRTWTYGLFLKDEPVAAAVLGFAKTRVIYLNGVSSPLGKETRAMFVLMDRLITDARDRTPVFDFEGSDIPGVASFFKGFGGNKTSYPRIVIARFPLFRIKRFPG